MAKVTYLGGNTNIHGSNPTRTDYVFYPRQAVEVKTEDIDCYAKKEKNGGPWHVDIGIVEKANTIIQEVAEELKKEKTKYKYGGKK